MTHYRKFVQAVVAAVLLLAFTQTSLQAAIIDGIVFAHDMENVSGDTISGMYGLPNATKSSSIGTSTTSPVPGGFSTQHLQTPNALSVTVDTNTKLTSPSTEFSFSMYYNDRGDAESLVRYVSSYNGGTVEADELLFDRLSNGRMRLITNNESVTSDVIPLADNVWHHVGVTYESGNVQFYFDGSPLGSPLVMATTSLAAQTSNWHLVEDAAGLTNTEYYDNGSYDEAALWNRVLSASEMNAVATQGLFTALAAPVPIPEPTTGIVLQLGSLLLLGSVRCRRRSA